MSAVSGWLMAVSVIAVIYVILESLLPSSSIKKYALFALSLFTMTLLLSPLISLLKGDAKNIKLDFSVNYEEINPEDYKDFLFKVYTQDKENNN